MKSKPFLLLVELADGWHVRTRTPDGKLVSDRITPANVQLVNVLLVTTASLAALDGIPGLFKKQSKARK